MSEIRVTVYKPSDRRNLMMKCVDPVTGKTLRKSAGTHVRREAERAAARWEAELNGGSTLSGPEMGWSAFVECYNDRKLSTLREATQIDYNVTLGLYGDAMTPRRVGNVTTEAVARFVLALREREVTDATIAKHLRNLRAAMRWAKRHKIVRELPQFEMPSGRGRRKAKGRPITGEEFERMLMVAHEVVGDDPAVVESWRDVLRCYWWTGLRLSEGLRLRWDRRPGMIEVRLNGRRSVMSFHPRSQKSGREELIPIAPEAVEWLETIRQETGWVLNPLRQDGQRGARTKQQVERRLNPIGERSRIQVNADTGKTATAQDLRRAFGTRWARRVPPAVLKTLMRHQSIKTTMEFYVDLEAEDSAEMLWEKLGHTSGHTPPDGGIDAWAKTLQNKG